ncbi:MAG: response regulator [Patescibacteria group bacterium]
MNTSRILLIDDDPNVQDIYGTALKTHGFEVAEALNGTEGLALALRDHPDLILLDLLMPGMTGFQLLEELRKDAWGRNAKVVVISNLKKEDNDMAVAEHLVFDYLNKSDHTLEEVCGRIELLLKA